jgi:hypothetical protein
MFSQLDSGWRPCRLGNTDAVSGQQFVANNKVPEGRGQARLHSGSPGVCPSDRRTVDAWLTLLPITPQAVPITLAKPAAH